MRNLTYSEAILEALTIALESDESVNVFGLGVPDPKGVFNTTIGLQERFGSARVFDTPTSENAMTGIGIGASIAGLRPVMVHQRVDFFLLALDQLINNAAKWRFMFGGRGQVPITIRLIIGHGWGQGPTHSQNLQALFSQIPGLKVVMPTSAYDAKGMLLESIFDDNPVVFLEHRWLHNLSGEVPEADYRVPLNSACIVEDGDAVTIVSMSYMTIEARKAVTALRAVGVNPELVDLRSTSHIDWDLIFESVKKTGKLLVVDSASQHCSVSSEIVSSVSRNLFGQLKKAPVQLAMPNFPSPTSYGLTKDYYIGAHEICTAALTLCDSKAGPEDMVIAESEHHDVPGNWFQGPF
jgi:pyruvate dehydrogenase E1 component beta subunit